MDFSRRGFLMGAGAASAFAPQIAQAYPQERHQIVVAGDPRTGEILYARDFNNPDATFEEIANRQVHIASVTKCMALLCIAEWAGEQIIDTIGSTAVPSDPLLSPKLAPYAAVLAQRIPISARARNTGGVTLREYYMAGKYAVDSLELNEMLCISLLASTNDLIEAMNDYIAATTGKSLVDRMNEKAAKIAMTNSHFYNAHGMPEFIFGLRRDNYSSANDLFKLDRAMEAERPEFLPYLEQAFYRPQRPALRDNIHHWVGTKTVTKGRGRHKKIEHYRIYEETKTIDTRAQYVSNDIPSPYRLAGSGGSTTEGQGDAQEIESYDEPPAAQTNEADNGDVSSLKYCIRAKTGFTSAAQKTILATFASPVNGKIAELYVFAAGAVTQKQRLGMLTTARDAGFQSLAAKPVVLLTNQPMRPENLTIQKSFPIPTTNP